jgi:signal transduction histidine kinase
LVTVTVILSILVIFLTGYITILQLQLRGINHQLAKRLKEHTRQTVSIELINRELNVLAVNINKCLKAEENLRLESIREEKHFKGMITDISHDLRTPLTAIKGYQQLIEKGILTEDQRAKLLIAEKHTDELGRLIEHFFEYAYLVNAEPVLQIEKINLTNLTAECLAGSITAFEKNNLAVNFHETKPVFVLADKEMTIRIIENLIRNSIQHSESDIDVEISTSKNAVISFKNFVENSSEIDVKKLFDRFYSSDKARIRTSGLGLSIVKLLAENMGGCAEAELKNGNLEILVKLPLWQEV